MTGNPAQPPNPDYLRAPSPGRSRVRGWLIAVTVVAVLIVVGAGVEFGLSVAHYSPPGTPPPPAPIANASFAVNLSAPRALAADVLGVNVRANYALGSAQSAALAASSVGFVRWPGGALADRLDPLADGGAGRIYSSSGSYAPPATSLADFVHWCASVHASAILTLPGEIDNASYAAEIARYVEDTLGFVPAYWEVGNEPALWTHFGVPWSRWTSSQAIAPTPAEYALEVGQYGAALRSVDPSARVLGLGGVGTGSSDGPWIQAVVARDGTNLSGLAIHVYPAGPLSGGATPAQFFGTLTGPASLSARVPADLAAIHAACASCQLPLLVDELGSVTGSNYPQYATGYNAAPYLAAELAEGIGLGVASLLVWNLQSTYPDAWLGPHGGPEPSYPLYATVLAHRPSTSYPFAQQSGPVGLYGIAGAAPSSAGPTATLLLVNTNTSYALRLSLGAAGYPVSPASTGYTWAPGSSAPTGPIPNATGNGTVVLPPLGIDLFESPGTWSVTPVGVAVDPAPAVVRAGMDRGLPGFPTAPADGPTPSLLFGGPDVGCGSLARWAEDVR